MILWLFCQHILSLEWWFFVLRVTWITLNINFLDILFSLADAINSCLVCTLQTISCHPVAHPLLSAMPSKTISISKWEEEWKVRKTSFGLLIKRKFFWQIRRFTLACMCLRWLRWWHENNLADDFWELFFLLFVAFHYFLAIVFASVRNEIERRKK